MDRKTTDFSHVAVVVARADKSLQLIGDRLEKALAAADPGEKAPVRLLSGEREFTAIEQAGNFIDPQAARKALEEAFEGDADICVSTTSDRRKKLLICDMDSTIIQQECLDELADFAGLKAEISEITERAMRGELEFEPALRERVGKLAGLDLARLDQCYRERITLMPGARTLVSTMKAQGAHAMLVSGGFTFFTSRIGEAAGFDIHRGNTLLDDGNALTGKVAEPILGRKAKLAALEEQVAALGLSNTDALAMGDGANDLAMIEAAGLGVAYRAKPVVAAASDCAINVTDLTAPLYFQGYTDTEIVWKH
ncbi:phosphoserine phosphatase SerB [Henriciella barbarensis]|uniref:Phosphoserine phosphatase n=1 Tax=Henriciella barbarensis TaxID=86342 RepID=A0A399QSZ3_9PROT|nr:phosphoserine phosphatase SerB [Henriciella barbarensis]RIJ21305.1 phosphoserine phosphatase SerB [Henriciella barbarensis]